MTNKKLIIILLAIVLTAVSIFFISKHKMPGDQFQVNEIESLAKIRIGWQIPWATQGQITQILKHTDILKKNGLEAEFIGRVYGPVLNEIALANGIDVVFTADQPAAALFSKDKGWIGVGRLMYNRTLTYVPLNSSITSIKELKGKTIGIPIGAAAERITMEALERNGLNPEKDVEIINVGIMEQSPLVLKGGKDASEWGKIDALSGFDPTPAIFQSKELIRTLDIGKVCSLVLMNQNFISSHPDVAKNMMQSIFDAYDYYRQHREQANQWFIAEAQLKDADNKTCDIAASIELNVWAKERKDIRVSFIDEDYEIMQKGADFLQDKLGKKVDMRKFVSNKYTEGVE
ncbi:MAG: ABC transporter substrate-binding protein [Patescibacteria group bacterium]|nr:ABC transporter substrate-binding protein [Patescibacteria group bacterium]